MNYEVVTLEEKTVAGTAARTNNFAPDCQMIIGNLWKQFFEDGIYINIEGKITGKPLGIYTEYDGDEEADYTVMVACEISEDVKIAGKYAVKKILAGKYAKFVIKGNMQEIVPAFWQELWQMDLPRAFGSDFEEYQNNDPEHSEIHVYISLKEA